MLAIGLAVAFEALLLVPAVSNRAEGAMFGPCSNAQLSLIFGSLGAPMLGSLGCAIFLAARRAPPDAYLLLVAVLAIVAGGLAVALSLSEVCAESLDTLLWFIVIALIAAIGALIGLAVGYVLGRLVRWVRAR